MQKHTLVVDGKVLGTFGTKSTQLKRLSVLKGIEVNSVEETQREKALRLQAAREKKKYKHTDQEQAETVQPSLIDGVPTVEAYRFKTA